MREYRYQITDASIEALRLLMRPWVRMAATDREIAIATVEGMVVRLSVERTVVEGVLEVSRLRADAALHDDAPPVGAREVPVTDLGQGRNDVVLFTAETWTEDAAIGASDGAASGQTMQFSGRPGQHPESATMVCTTTDAIVVAAATGEGVLIQIGVRPSTLDVVQDRAAIARFLVQRGYTSEDSGAS